MAVLIKKNKQVAIEIESVSGVYEGAPDPKSFIKAQAEAVTLNKTKEELTQELLGTGIGSDFTLHGLATASGSIGMPMTTNIVEGAKSPLSDSLQSLLGSMRVVASLTSTAATASLLTFASHSIKKNDVIIVKSAGLFEARPVASVTSTTVSLAWALSAAPDAEVEVAAFRQYAPACSNPSLSITEYLGTCTTGAENLIKKAWGMLCISMSVDNFVTGQLADITFGYEGIGFDKVSGAAVVGDYSEQAQRSAIIGAVVYQNGAVFKVNEFGLAVTNSVAPLSNTKNGKESLKVIKREVTGKINPYMVTGAAGLTQYQIFDQNQPFSLLVTQSNPTPVDGERKNYINYWMPNCQISALEEGDYQSHLTDNVSFKAFNTDMEGDDLFISIS